MAGNEQGERIAMAGSTDGTDRIGVPDALRQIGIGDGCAIWNVHETVPNRLLKGCAERGERLLHRLHEIGREGPTFAFEIAGQLGMQLVGKVR